MTIIRYSNLNWCANILKYYVEVKINQFSNFVTLLNFYVRFTLAAVPWVYKNELKITTPLGHAFKIVFDGKWYQAIPV